MNNKYSNSTNTKEDFLRMPVFLRDADKIICVFPFYHDISDAEYNAVIENFYEETGLEPPSKKDFCLMYEPEFGWGWIHSEMIHYLVVAPFEEYQSFEQDLVQKRVIHPDLVLNED